MRLVIEEGGGGNTVAESNESTNFAVQSSLSADALAPSSSTVVMRPVIGKMSPVGNDEVVEHKVFAVQKPSAISRIGIGDVEKPNSTVKGTVKGMSDRPVKVHPMIVDEGLAQGNAPLVSTDTAPPEKKGWRDCKAPGCKKCRQGNTQFCKEHGGGRKCQVKNCTKLARGKFFCASHGGGKRCSEPSCIRMAVGTLGKCIAHGGGKRCIIETCGKAAQSASQYCFKHAQVVLKFKQQKTVSSGLESLAEAAFALE